MIAALRQLSTVLDEFFAAVPQRDQATDGRRGRYVAGRQRSARWSSPGPEALQKGADAGDDDRRGALGSRSRQSTSRRRPIVSTDGLTRSNGSVSQAGKSRPRRPAINWLRSSASWPAIVPVGAATTSGRRPERWARAAMEIGRATP